MAVRNESGGYYLCQALQNIYRASKKIKIQWLSENEKDKSKQGDIYIKEYYDTIGKKKTSFEERRVNDRGLKNAARMWHGRGQFHHYFMISFCASRFMRIFLAHKERRSCGVSNTWPANIKKNEDFSLI